MPITVGKHNTDAATLMTLSSSSTDNPRTKKVYSFQELANTPFADGINALCWSRSLAGDFGEVVTRLGATDEIMTLDEKLLNALSVSPAGRIAVETMLADLQLLRTHDFEPVLNCITGYPRDEEAELVRTDVFSFHADSAPIPASTWLCTYHGSPSEGLLNEEALRRVDVPATRAELLRQFGGEDNDEFAEYLRDHCYDLHYAPQLNARPYSFGVGNLWRIACDFPNSPVPPCIHRAPETIPGEPRLLLIS